VSLTSLLQTSEVRQRFREEFEKPTTAASPDRVAPVISDRPAHVGTAFDYLLRFLLRRINPDTIRDRRWVAEVAVQLLPEDNQSTAQQIIEEAKSARETFVESGTLRRETLDAVLRLAHLDVVVRTRSDGSDGLPSSDPVSEVDLEDLRQLYEVVPRDQFETKRLCFLNPTFGKASALVGGADADLVVDETLIDVKTVKDSSLTRDAFNQLLGYYTLHVIGGVGGLDPKPEINRIGVYFSRHAHLYTVDLERVIDRSTYPDFVEWFARYAMGKRLG
jgi:hypothetical protein